MTQKNTLPRRRAFAVAGTALALAAGVGLASLASAQLPIFGMGHRGPDPDRMRARAERMTQHLLGEIQASDAQRDRIRTIVSGLIDDLVPLAEAQAEQRGAWRAELGRTQIDPGALEALRADALARADQMSTRMLRALLDAAAELTPEQRARAIALAEDFRSRRGHGRRGRGGRMGRGRRGGDVPPAERF